MFLSIFFMSAGGDLTRDCTLEYLILDYLLFSSFFNCAKSLGSDCTAKLDLSSLYREFFRELFITIFILILLKGSVQ